MAASRSSAAARAPERRVRDDSILPSEILLLGARPSQEVKCFALDQEARSSLLRGRVLSRRSTLTHIGTQLGDLSFGPKAGTQQPFE
jgi:hypothetical protein